MFVFHDDEGNEVLPAYVFRDLKDHAIQQTKALKSFSTDLADGIRISTETINVFGDKVREAMEKSIKDEMAPVISEMSGSLSKIEEAVRQLQQAKEESAGEFIQKVLSELKDPLQNMGGQLRDSLSESTVIRMENLVNLMGDASTSLSTFPNLLQDMMHKMEEQVIHTKEVLENASESVTQEARLRTDEANRFFHKILEELKEAISIQQKSIQETTSKAGKEAAVASELFKEQAEAAANQLGGAVGVLEKNIENMLDRQAQNTQAFNECH